MYNFDEEVNRRNIYSLKWDVPADELPMWVADMDFKTAPEIIDALRERVNHGVFGYNIIPDEWYSAYQNWWQKRHHFEIQKDWLIFAIGVVPILSSIVRKLTTPGEKVLIQTPVYNVFFNCIVNQGCTPLESELSYKDGVYSIDFAKLEKDLSDPQVALMILCNPHNPVGKIWSKEELAKIGELCKKYNVTVVSDEIHCDLLAPNQEYVPFASVNETCKDISITCVAASKAFNLAGLQSAACFVPNKFLRHKVWRGLNTDDVAEPNTFAVISSIVAFNQGEKWLDELRVYLQENKQIVKDFLEKNLPKIKVVSLDATYLLWLDCSEYTNDTEELALVLREKAKVYLTYGGEYGKGGESFLRLNVATQRKNIIEGLNRMLKIKEFLSNS
ncbi:MAG: MalY/PatB family protein [Succinivibrionaceae bacterium]|nr:MalY/PatB family protein [Succinivibrionaceae bacterium]